MAFRAGGYSSGPEGYHLRIATGGPAPDLRKA